MVLDNMVSSFIMIDHCFYFEIYVLVQNMLHRGKISIWGAEVRFRDNKFQLSRGIFALQIWISIEEMEIAYILYRKM